MIRLTEAAALSAELATRETLCAARISTLIAAWQGIPAQRGTPDFYRTDSGAVLSVLGDACTLDGTEFDASELCSFLQMRGCQTLTCSGVAAQRITIPAETVLRPVLRYTGGSMPPNVPELETAPPLAQIYLLLREVFDNMDDVRFDTWYTDVSLRIRRGLSQVYGISENGFVCSTAGIYYQNSCTAVISSVATHPQSRGRGYAGALITALARTAALSGKTALIAAKTPQAEVLYTHLGFVPCAQLADLTFLDSAGPVTAL